MARSRDNGQKRVRAPAEPPQPVWEITRTVPQEPEWVVALLCLGIGGSEGLTGPGVVRISWFSHIPRRPWKCWAR